MRRAFDRGITHFDLANTHGPPAGAAEANLGRIFAEASAKGMSLHQMAINWKLRHKAVTSSIIGFRIADQLNESVAALSAHRLDEITLEAIDCIAPMEKARHAEN